MPVVQFTVVQFTHAIVITPASLIRQESDALEWNGNAHIVALPQGEVTLNSEGLVGFGSDLGFSSTGGSPSFFFSGFTIDADGANAAGETYAIFFNPVIGTYRIPFNLADHDIRLLADGAVTMDTTTLAVEVFNCFATGTRIATPDGDKPIEMLRAGEKVLTHDGRSAPVIWRARQSITNPRNLSVGRGPVRIEAGALGPNLPDAPLTVTADHALLFDERNFDPPAAACRPAGEVQLLASGA